MKLAYLMTTKDRIPLLKVTIESLLKAGNNLENFYVFDDCSDDFKSVFDITSELKGVTIKRGKVNRGCNAKTPEAMAWLFDNGFDAVCVLDSDCLFNKDWNAKLKHALNQKEIFKHCSVLSLFNCGGDDKIITYNGMSFSEKNEVGALGCIFTKEFYTKYIMPVTNRAEPWDAQATRAASKELPIYCFVPSLIQHLGTSVGQHVGGTNVATSHDFTSNESYYVKLQPGDSKKIFASCMGKIEDLLMASAICNALGRYGYQVELETTRHYSEISGCLALRYANIVRPGSIDDVVLYTDIFDMKERMPGFGYYLNLQTISPEHRGRIGTGDKLVYLLNYCSENLGKKISVTPEDICYRVAGNVPRLR